jgi:hypothetical protein
VAVGTGIQACKARDVNGDNVTDFLCTSSNAVSYIQGVASGAQDTFLSKINIVESSQPIVAVEVNDVNQDGYQDLLLLDKGDHAVRLYLGDGAGGFAKYQSQLKVLTDVTDLRTVDFDGDGCQDLMVTSKKGITLMPSLGCGAK